MNNQRIAQLHREIANEFESGATNPAPNPKPTQPETPKDGKVELALVFVDQHQFDLWINDILIPKSRPFDYVNGKIGVKIIRIDQLRTFRTDPNQLKVNGLNNEGFGFVSFKIVNKAEYVTSNGQSVPFDMTKLRPTHGEVGFWGDGAGLGTIWNYSGSTAVGKYKDPEFYKGHQETRGGDRIFHPQWSATGKVVIGVFNYGINSVHTF